LTRRDCQDAWRLSRFVETRRDFQDLSRCSRDLSRPFESENDEKSRRIEKSRRENTKIHALLDRDRDKLSRNAEIFRSRQISQSRLRFFGLDVDVETKSRYLDCRDLLLDAVKIFSTVETHSLTTSRSRVSIETTSRQIETPRLTFEINFLRKVPKMAYRMKDHSYSQCDFT
jgi:hypothetical protein